MPRRHAKGADRDCIPGEVASHLEHARAGLAYLRDASIAARLQLDSGRVVLAGHSLGGWAPAEITPRHPALLGVVLISAADMAPWAASPSVLFSADRV